MKNLWEDFSDWFDRVTDPVKQFFLENSRNPFLWVAIIVIALVIFEAALRRFNKN